MIDGTGWRCGFGAVVHDWRFFKRNEGLMPLAAPNLEATGHALTNGLSDNRVRETTHFNCFACVKLQT